MDDGESDRGDGQSAAGETAASAPGRPSTVAGRGAGGGDRKSRCAGYRLVLADAVLAHLGVAMEGGGVRPPVLLYRCQDDDFALVLRAELGQLLRERGVGEAGGVQVDAADKDDAVSPVPNGSCTSVPLFVRLDCIGSKRKRGDDKAQAASAGTVTENGIQYSTFHEKDIPPRGRLPFPDAYFGAAVLVAP